MLDAVGRDRPRHTFVNPRGAWSWHGLAWLVLGCSSPGSDDTSATLVLETTVSPTTTASSSETGEIPDTTDATTTTGTPSTGTPTGTATDPGSESDEVGSDSTSDTAPGEGPCTAPGLVWCEDFEDVQVGALPGDPPWTAVPLPEFCQGSPVEVGEGVAWSGSRSLAARSANPGCMQLVDVGTSGDFWVRSRIHWDAGSNFTEHEVSAFELAAGQTDDPGIRFGFRGDNSCNPTGVEITITGGGEQTGCTGFQLQADTWYCIEMHVTESGGGVTTDLFIDGVDQSFTIHGQPAEVVTNPDGPRSPLRVRLGVRSYGGIYQPLIHLDDFAIGTQRIGCG